MKQTKRLLAVLLCLAMVAGMIPAALAAGGTEAQTGSTDAEWEEIQSIISQYYGEWTTPNYPNATSKKMPFTALMGNGDVGVSSDGSATTKKFNISKGDFWEYNDSETGDKDRTIGVPMIGGSLTVSQNVDADVLENLAPKAITVTTSDGSNGKPAVDGRTVTHLDNSDGWISSGDGDNQWLQLEFAEAITFNQWKMYNHSYTHSGARMTTQDAQLQISEDGQTWTTISAIEDNAQTVVLKKLSTSYTTKYVRLLITDPAYEKAADRKARIPQLCLYFNDTASEDGPKNLVPEYETVTASSTFMFYTPEQAVNGEWHNDDYQVWCTPIGKTHWLEVDMGKEITFNRWVVRNDGAGRPGQSDLNTKDCKLQISKIGGPDADDWQDIDVVTGNKDDVITRDLSQTYTARYIRLYITDPTQGGTADSRNNPRARVGQFELYNMSEEDLENEKATEEPVSYREVQDILNAEVRTTQTIADVPLEFKTWLSATDNIMVMEITSKAQKTTGQLAVDLVAPEGTTHKRPVSAEAGSDYALVTRTTLSVKPEEEGSYRSQIAIASQVLNKQATYSADAEKGTAKILFEIEPGETVYLVTAICGGGKTYTPDMGLWEGRTAPAEEAKTQLAAIHDASDVEKLHQAHQAWWKEYWMASYISLDENNDDLQVIQKYYYGAQYEVGCTVRDGYIAPGLYGIWRTDPSDQPQWYSDYHLNYNFIATFFGSASSNRLSQLLPAVEAIEDYIPTAKANASSVSELKRIDTLLNGTSMGHVDRQIAAGKIDAQTGISDAVLYPVSIGPYGMDMIPKYLNETLNAPYSAYPMIEYYNYTQDLAFAEEHLYPYLKLVLNFLEAWVVEEPEGSGKYTIYAGYNEGSWAKNPAVELAGYKNCLKTAIALSEKLNQDTEKRAVWEDLYNGLAEQPRVEDYQGTGKTVLSLAEQEYKNGQWVNMATPVPTDANCLPLDSMLPGDVYGYYSSEEDLKVLQNTIDVFSQIGGWTKINNFPRIFSNAVNARYDCQTIVTKLASTIRSQLAPNLMINDGTHGIEKAGATKAINNMMLLEDEGVIKLFGNWLEDTDAKFVRLRAPGAFLFSAEYDGDAKEVVEGVTMYSEAGATATIASLWDEGMAVFDSKGNLVSTTVGTAPNHEEEITYTFDTVKGETYTLKKAVAVTGVTLDKETAALTVGETTTLTATVAPSDATNKAVVWTSSDETVATVDDNGVVTAVGAGEAVITATTADGGKTATCVVTVTAPAPDVDKSGLAAAIDDAEAIEDNDYISSTWTAFQKALAKAKEVLADPDATQAEVDAAEAALRSAMAGLEKKPAHPILPGNSGGSTTTPTTPVTNDPFIDVTEGDLFYDDIQYVYENDIMNGTGSGKFSPKADLTRGMVVTILYRLEQEPNTSYTALFADVANGQWYTEGVEWAASEGIVTGYTNGKFGPNDPVTREQLAAILYRYAQSKGYVLAEGSDLTAYSDASNISPYAVDAVKWAVAEGLLLDTNGMLSPRANATRAEVAHAIAVFCQYIGK